MDFLVNVFIFFKISNRSKYYWIEVSLVSGVNKYKIVLSSDFNMSHLN